MTTSEKVAYLKGLADGLGLGRETKEEKLISAIIDTLECIALDIEDLEESTFDLGEEIDAISDDLEAVEDFLYDESCDDDCCCHDHDDDCCSDFADEDYEHDGCCHDHREHHDHHGHHGHEHGGCGCGHHHGAVMYEITCPACNNTITVDEDVLNLGSIQCPSCGGLLEFDFEGSEAESKPGPDKE
jgi:hypothetical protein